MQTLIIFLHTIWFLSLTYTYTFNRLVIAAPKSIQATVTLLENLHIILEKTPPSDIRSEILPLLFNSFESNTMQIQSAALLAVANVYEYVDEVSIRRMVLPKIKTVFEKNQSDLKIMANVLQCIERVLDKLEKSQIIDEVLPMLYEIRLSDPEIILRIVRKLSWDNDFDFMNVVSVWGGGEKGWKIFGWKIIARDGNSDYVDGGM